jgi:hypothetical protein
VSKHKSKEHLTKIKDAVSSSIVLSESEKTDTIKRLDEWIIEDKADGILLEELIDIASGMRPILKELGLL